MTQVWSRHTRTESCWGFVCNCQRCEVTPVEQACHLQGLTSLTPDLQDELARMEASGREASMEAQRAEEALAALQGRWEEAQPRLALYDELCALRDRQQAEIVELRAQATATKEEALAANTQLAGAQDAAAEAKSAAAAEQEKLREQLAAAATAAEAQR